MPEVTLNDPPATPPAFSFLALLACARLFLLGTSSGPGRLSAESCRGGAATLLQLTGCSGLTL